MPNLPAAGSAKGLEPWAETNRPGLVWSRTRSKGAPVRRSWLPHRASVVAGSQSGRCAYSQPGARAGVWFSGFESFPLCYTAGRHEGAQREPKVELMTEPADRAVLLLQKVSELLLESRAIVKELEAVPDSESSADAADRIA